MEDFLELYFFLGKVIDFSRLTLFCTKVQYKRKIIKIQSKLKVSRGIFQKGALLFSGGVQNFRLAGQKSLQGGKQVQGAPLPPPPPWKKASLLNQAQGYKMGSTERSKNLTHLFFVNDLKIYASNLEQSKYQLDVIKTFSKDIGMMFGEDKCGYIYIKWGSIDHKESQLSLME